MIVTTPDPAGGGKRRFHNLANSSYAAVLFGEPPMRALLILALLAAAPAGAAQVCGWIDEAVDTDSSHNLTLWFEADAEIDLGYSIGGNGMSDESGRVQSPSNGNLYLKPGAPETPWMIGTSINPPTTIDVIASITAQPTRSDAKPVSADFTFQRVIPTDESVPSTLFAKRQCVTVPAP
jgi:hypothetical protein